MNLLARHIKSIYIFLGVKKSVLCSMLKLVSNRKNAINLPQSAKGCRLNRFCDNQRWPEYITLNSSRWGENSAINKTFAAAVTGK